MHPEVLNHSNLHELSRISHPSKQQRKNAALRNPDFFMDITYKQYHKVNQINKGTMYLKIYHQNIRGLGKKAGELLSYLHPDLPHVLCLTEHHLKYSQLENVDIENYNLGAYYCRQLQEKGDAAIFVHNSLCFSNIDNVQHSKKQDIEICALELPFGILNICVLTHYRAPSGNCSCFLFKLDTVLQFYILPLYTSLFVRT